MPSVSREAAEHTPNINPGSKLVKQGLQCFNQQKCQAMDKELSRLLASLRKSSIEQDSCWNFLAIK
jgi:hypothetical protein